MPRRRPQTRRHLVRMPRPLTLDRLLGQRSGVMPVRRRALDSGTGGVVRVGAGNGVSIPVLRYFFGTSVLRYFGTSVLRYFGTGFLDETGGCRGVSLRATARTHPRRGVVRSGVRLDAIRGVDDEGCSRPLVVLWPWRGRSPVSAKSSQCSRIRSPAAAYSSSPPSEVKTRARGTSVRSKSANISTPCVASRPTSLSRRGAKSNRYDQTGAWREQVSATRVLGYQKP